MKILLIECDRAFGNLVVQAFEKVGVQVTQWLDFYNAIVEIKKNTSKYDIILISKEGPKGDEGLDLIESLRQDPATIEIPTVFLSKVWGKVDFAKHQKSKAGANAYFEKKRPLKELVSTIEAVCGKKLQETKSIQTASLKKDKTTTLNVALVSADDVLSHSNEQREGIELSQPISIFDGASLADEKSESKQAQSEAPASQNSVQLEAAIELPSLSIETASVAEKIPESVAISSTSSETSGGIEIRFDSPPLPVEMKAEIVSEPVVDPLPEAIKEIKIVDAPLSPQSEFEADDQAARDLPYLFSGTTSIKVSELERSNGPSLTNPEMLRSMLQSSSSGSEDIEALKKYLMMREQDIAVLTVQLTYAKEELEKSEELIRKLTLENEDYFHQLSDVKTKLADREQQLHSVGKSMEGEVEQLRSEMKSKIDRIRYLEEKLEDSASQYEKLKDRVRLDIRKIRVREKELENKLEILKKDSETLIASRENKILELKRKIDMLEFNYDTLLDKNEQEKEKIQGYQEKIERIEKVLKLAVGVVLSSSEDGKTQDSNLDTNSALRNKAKVA